jgi:hypothetical protein
LIDAILHKLPAPLRGVNGAIPAELERIILKCLDKEPENRYQSAKELVVDLRRLEGASTGAAVAAPLRKRPWRRPMLEIGGAVTCALMAAALWPRLPHNHSTGLPALRWEQLTNFNDSAEIPTLSRDGKLVAFLRGPGSFGSSANAGRFGSGLCRMANPFNSQRPPYGNRRSFFRRTAAVCSLPNWKVSLSGTPTSCRCWARRSRNCSWQTPRA